MVWTSKLGLAFVAMAAMVFTSTAAHAQNYMAPRHYTVSSVETYAGPIGHLLIKEANVDGDGAADFTRLLADECLSRVDPGPNPRLLELDRLEWRAVEQPGPQAGKMPWRRAVWSGGVEGGPKGCFMGSCAMGGVSELQVSTSGSRTDVGLKRLRECWVSARTLEFDAVAAMIRRHPSIRGFVIRQDHATKDLRQMVLEGVVEQRPLTIVISAPVPSDVIGPAVEAHVVGGHFGWVMKQSVPRNRNGATAVHNGVGLCRWWATRDRSQGLAAIVAAGASLGYRMEADGVEPYRPAPTSYFLGSQKLADGTRVAAILQRGGRCELQLFGMDAPVEALAHEMGMVRRAPPAADGSQMWSSPDTRLRFTAAPPEPGPRVDPTHTRRLYFTYELADRYRPWPGAEPAPVTPAEGLRNLVKGVCQPLLNDGPMTEPLAHYPFMSGPRRYDTRSYHETWEYMRPVTTGRLAVFYGRRTRDCQIVGEALGGGAEAALLQTLSDEGWRSAGEESQPPPRIRRFSRTLPGEPTQHATLSALTANSNVGALVITFALSPQPGVLAPKPPGQ